MLLTVEGTYTEGKVELIEQPTGIKRAKVLVTFLTTEEKPEFPRPMRYGQFAGESTLFKLFAGTRREKLDLPWLKYLVMAARRGSSSAWPRPAPVS